MVSKIQAGQTFSRRPTAHPDTMGENNTVTAFKGCEVKILQQALPWQQLWLEIPPELISSRSS